MRRQNLKRITVAGGAVLLLLISPYITAILPLIPHIHTPGKMLGIIFPGNIVLLLMPLLLGYGVIFFFPCCFIIMSAFFHKKNYAHCFTYLASIVMILDIAWIIMSWQGGIRYQKLDFARAVIFENTACFLIIYALITAYYKYKYTALLYFSTFLLCLTLMFFAFPWLGEPI